MIHFILFRVNFCASKSSVTTVKHSAQKYTASGEEEGIWRRRKNEEYAMVETFMPRTGLREYCHPLYNPVKGRASAMDKAFFDISAYLVVGPENTRGRSVGSIVSAAVGAGFTCVQIRSKVASARELISLTREAACEIERLGASERVALLVDDRLDVALAARSAGIPVDGIHVGQSDIPPNVCREFLGSRAIVGLSARTRDLIGYVKDADIGVVDYIGTGPLHETSTKPESGRDEDGNIVTRSLDELTTLARVSPVPVVVGGGVKLDDIPALSRTGVDGFFVVSAVAGADDPARAARELVDAWTRANPRRNASGI